MIDLVLTNLSSSFMKTTVLDTGISGRLKMIGDFDKTRCKFFLIKEEKVFDKYNEILEKVSDIIKKNFNGEFAYNKKYPKINTKEGFQWFYAPVILINSFYRKDKTIILKCF